MGEQLISKLQIPLFFIAFMLLLLVAAQASQAYNNFWQGKLAKKTFLKD